VIAQDLAPLLEQYRSGLEAELSLLRQLAAVSARQREHMHAGHFERFEAAADDRDAIMRGLVNRLRAADRQIESLALLDVYGRVARTLLDMSEMDGELKIIRNKVSRQDLAKVVGASREMVSRVMKDLESRGMVQTQENGWVVIKELTAN